MVWNKTIEYLPKDRSHVWFIVVMPGETRRVIGGAFSFNDWWPDSATTGECYTNKAISHWQYQAAKPDLPKLGDTNG